jgi:hypothetical protein
MWQCTMTWCTGVARAQSVAFVHLRLPAVAAAAAGDRKVRRLGSRLEHGGAGLVSNMVGLGCAGAV